MKMYRSCIPYFNRPFLEICRFPSSLQEQDLEYVKKEDLFIFFDNQDKEYVLKESIVKGDVGESKALSKSSVNSEMKLTLTLKGFHFSG